MLAEKEMLGDELMQTTENAVAVSSGCLSRVLAFHTKLVNTDAASATAQWEI
jgi:hypothetical protein